MPKFNPRDLVLKKEAEVSNGVYGRQATKRCAEKKYFEVHSEDL